MKKPKPRTGKNTRPRSMKPPKPHHKRRGEIAELAFMHKAARMGLIVSKPHGESAPFDLVVIGGRKLSRIQLKAATKFVRGKNHYSITTWWSRGRIRSYTTREIDFLVAYAEPEDAWYIFPPRIFRGRKSLTLPRSGWKGKSLFRPYRDRWDLLFDGPNSSLNLLASADPLFADHVGAGPPPDHTPCGTAALGCDLSEGHAFRHGRNRRLPNISSP